MNQPDLFPGWEIAGNPIGKGGNGVVYEIRRELFGDVERSALKVIRIPKDPEELDYLRVSGMDDQSIIDTLYGQVSELINEYKLMRQFRDNPNIVHCQDFRCVPHEDGFGWDIYIMMELLTPLMKSLHQVSTETQVIRFGIDICNALITCQEHRIIHRDIKPENIFLSSAGKFKLGDFGIARVMEKTTRASLAGTPSFMAPEVFKGEAYGATVDIYSLGLVLHWLLNNKRIPFLPLPPERFTIAMNEEARSRRLSGEQVPAPSHGSPGLKKIVLKACAYDPSQRYASALEMKEALERLLAQKNGMPEEDLWAIPSPGSQPAPLPEETVSERQRPSGRKRVWLIGAGVLMAFLVMVTGFTGLFTWLLRRDDVPQMEPAAAEQAQTEPAEITAAPAPDIAPAVPGYPWRGNVMRNPHYLERLFDLGIQKTQVGSITFLDTLKDAPEDACDASQEGNRSVLAWVVPNNGYYDLYIAGEGGVNAPRNSSCLFYGFEYAHTIDLTHFHTDNAEDMSCMFSSCPRITSLDLRNFDTSRVTDMTSMFVDCSDLETLDVSGFDTSRVRVFNAMFSGCAGLKALDLSGFDTSGAVDFANMFSDCKGLTRLELQNFDTSQAQRMDDMFFGCEGLKELDISSFNTAQVTEMNNMFRLCSSLTELDLSHFDTSQVTTMLGMFEGCASLASLDLSAFDTAQVTDMTGMFFGCTQLTSLELSHFDTSQVRTMSGMFASCTGLKTLDLSGFNTSQVTDMSSMFQMSTALTALDLSGFDTANVTDMGWMFYECESLSTLDLSGFDTSKVTSMQCMFAWCQALTELDISGFDISGTADRTDMFTGCPIQPSPA